jgi:group I intron endonuclease
MPHLFKCKPGIYKMTNKVSGNYYIGSSSNISVRISGHKSLLFKKDYGNNNIRIKNDLNKYGARSFEFEVLEYCDNSIRKIREQYYFELLKPTFNIWPTVHNAKGRSYTLDQLKKCFPKREIKDKKAFSEKLKAAWKIRRERPDGISTLKMLDRTGKKHSEETKKLYSDQRKGKMKSYEFKEKIRRSRLGTKWDSINKTWIKGEK